MKQIASVAESRHVNNSVILLLFYYYYAGNNSFVYFILFYFILFYFILFYFIYGLKLPGIGRFDGNQVLTSLDFQIEIHENNSQLNATATIQACPFTNLRRRLQSVCWPRTFIPPVSHKLHLITRKCHIFVSAIHCLHCAFRISEDLVAQIRSRSSRVRQSMSLFIRMLHVIWRVDKVLRRVIALNNAVLLTRRQQSISRQMLQHHRYFNRQTISYVMYTHIMPLACRHPFANANVPDLKSPRALQILVQEILKCK